MTETSQRKRLNPLEPARPRSDFRLVPFKILLTYEATPCASQAEYMVSAKCSVLVDGRLLSCKVTPNHDLIGVEYLSQYSTIDIWFGIKSSGKHSFVGACIKSALALIRSINRKRKKEITA